MGEVDIGIIPDTISPTIQMGMVDFWVYPLILVLLMTIFMVMKDVIVVVMVEDLYIGLKRT